MAHGGASRSTSRRERIQKTDFARSSSAVALLAKSLAAVLALAGAAFVVWEVLR